MQMMLEGMAGRRTMGRGGRTDGTRQGEGICTSDGERQRVDGLARWDVAKMRGWWEGEGTRDGAVRAGQANSGWMLMHCWQPPAGSAD